MIPLSYIIIGIVGTLLFFYWMGGKGDIGHDIVFIPKTCRKSLLDRFYDKLESYL